MLGPVLSLATNEIYVVAEIPMRFENESDPNSTKFVVVYERENRQGADLLYALRSCNEPHTRYYEVQRLTKKGLPANDPNVEDGPTCSTRASTTWKCSGN